MEINVCIPVLNSYETLYKSIETINSSLTPIHGIYVLDNGGRFESINDIPNLKVTQFGYNLGVAASWNWFINNVPSIRLICNDDVFFYENTIQDLIDNYKEDGLIFPASVPAINAFSCFILPDRIIDAVGLFDETISPGYGYFEDNDYYRRMILAGYNIYGVGTRIAHIGSSTLKHFSITEESAHHKKFKRARDNYIRKWGGPPGEERYSVPYNGHA